MAAYVRELLCDIASGRFDSLENCETRIDLIYTLQHLYNTGQLTMAHLHCLRQLAYGVDIVDMGFDNAEDMLRQTLLLLEQESRYTDERIVDIYLSKRRKHAPLREALIMQVIAYGNTFEKGETHA